MDVGAVEPIVVYGYGILLNIKKYIFRNQFKIKYSYSY